MKAQTIYHFGNFVLDPAAHKLTRHDESVSVSTKSFDCIVYLIQNSDRSVGKDELISAVWGRADVSDSGLSQTISRARRAVNDSGEAQSRIRTVSNVGFQWVGEFSTKVAKPKPDILGSNDVNLTTPIQRRALPLWIGLSGLLIVALVWVLKQSNDQTPNPATTASNTKLAVVLPVVVNADSPDSNMVRLGSMSYIASRLRENSDLSVMPDEQVLLLVVDINKKQEQADLVKQIRARTGAGLIVQPTAELEEDSWHIHLRIDAGEQIYEVEAEAIMPLDATTVATSMLLQRLGFQTYTKQPLSSLTELLQQVEAELLAGEMATARTLIATASPEHRQDQRLEALEGQLEFRAGNLEIAEQLFHKILSANPAPDVHARALMGLGGVTLRQKDFAASEQYYNDAIELIENSGGKIKDQALIGNAYNGRGVSRIELGGMEDGIADLGKARIIMKRAGDELRAASVGGNIGILEARRGNGERALQEFDQSIETFERFGVLDNLATTLMAKANTEMELLLPMPALASSRRAMEIGESLENSRLTNAIELVHIDALLSNGLLDNAGTRLSQMASGAERRRLRWLLESGKPEMARQEALLLEPAWADSDLALLVVQTALLTGDNSLLAAWLLERDVFQDNFEALFALALAIDSADASMTGKGARFEAALDAALLQRSPEQEVRVASAWVIQLLEAGQLDRASAVLGGINLYVNRDYRAARAALDLYTALGDSTMQRNKAEIVNRLAGERNPTLPVIY